MPSSGGGERDRINHVHYRNVRVRRPSVAYTEVFPDEGQVDLVAVMKELVRQKYSRALYADRGQLGCRSSSSLSAGA